MNQKVTTRKSEAPPLEIMVQLVDQEGAPKAWAVGPADQEQAVIERAWDHLDLYIEKKQLQGFSLLCERQKFRLRLSRMNDDA